MKISRFRSGSSRISAGIISVCLLAVLTAGCSVRITRARQAETSEHVFARNYTLHRAATANVGDAMISVKDYWMIRRQVPVSTPERDVLVSLNARAAFRFRKDVAYENLGLVDLEGQQYAAVRSDQIVNDVGDPVDNPSGRWLAVLVRADGSLHPNRVLIGSRSERIFWTAPVSDEKALFRSGHEVSVDPLRGYINFEVLYSGVNSHGINLAYREYSREGLARAAFFQNLTYPAGARTIAFREFQIQVERADAEAITFRVLKDGLETRP